MLEEIDLSTHQEHYPSDVHFHELGDTLLCTHVVEGGVPRVYEVVGETDRPQVMLQADAVVDAGVFLETGWNGDCVLTQHPMAGIRDRYVPGDRTNIDPVLQLRRLSRPEVNDDE